MEEIFLIYQEEQIPQIITKKATRKQKHLSNCIFNDATKTWPKLFNVHNQNCIIQTANWSSLIMKCEEMLPALFQRTSAVLGSVQSVHITLCQQLSAALEALGAPPSFNCYISYWQLVANVFKDIQQKCVRSVCAHAHAHTVDMILNNRSLFAILEKTQLKCTVLYCTGELYWVLLSNNPS